MTGRITRFLTSDEPGHYPAGRVAYARMREELRDRGLVRLHRKDPAAFAAALAEAEAEDRATDPGFENIEAYRAFIGRRGTRMRKLEAEGLRLLRAQFWAAKKASVAA